MGPEPSAMALACDANSLQLLIHLTNDDIEIEGQSLDRLREVQARAVVLVPASGDFDSQDSNLETMQAIQLIRQRQTSTNCAALLVDDHGAIRDAIVFLAKSGHTGIAYIGADAALSSGRERLAAFRQGLKVTGIPAKMDLIHTDTPSFDMGRAATEKLLGRTSATALVCGGFEISNGPLSALMDRNHNPSGTFTFIGYGDPSFYSWIDGGLSTIRVPVESLAGRAAELVATCTDTQNSQPLCTERYSAELVIRGGA